MDRDWVVEFREWALTRQPNPMQPSSARAYERELRRLERNTGKRAEELDADALRRYHAQHRNDQASTWNNRYFAMAAFYKYLRQQGFYQRVGPDGQRRSDPSEAIGPRRGEGPKSSGPAADVVAAISAMSQGRDKQVATFIYLTGLKTGEAESIKDAPKDGRLHVMRRGGKWEWVPVSPKALVLLEELGGRVVVPGSRRRSLERRLPISLREIEQASKRDFQMRGVHGGAPVWELFAGRPDLLDVARAFRDATEATEGPKPNPKAAITAAARALQEMLTTMGARGNRLGPLFDSARARGLFQGHDAKLVDALQSLVDWVSADRSERGDAHKETGAGPEDAAMALRIVAALLLRLEAVKSP